MKYKKSCIICGAEFAPRLKTQLCCSKICSKKHHARSQAEWSKTDHARKLARAFQRKHLKTVLCRICGKEIKKHELPTGRIARITMHEECIIADCLKTLSHEQKLMKKQYDRLYQRGIPLEEVKEMLNSIRME